MNKLERKMLFLGILLLGLFSILFCVHSVAMILLPVGISEWIYWLLYSIFLVLMYKYFVDKHLSIIKCVIFPIIVIVFKFIIDLAMVNITNNLMDLLLSAYFSQIESCIFQLIILIILFFGLGRKKCLNKIFIVKIPSLVLSSGVLIYIIIAIIYRMQDPIDKTLLLEGNISYHLMLQMRNINFIFNLMVLPCFWIIIRNITLEKNKK